MSNVRIVLNRDAVRSLLLSQEVENDIARRAAAIANAAGQSGGTFGHNVVRGANRVHGMVWTDDQKAREAEATDRALTQAIDAGRS